jgi:DNA-binding MarR family transcriptional regulator
VSELTADAVWAQLVRTAMDGNDTWRRAVVDRTGLPFSRIRVLKRLGPGPMTMKELAHSATIDAPAATVAVNELESRGLVVREVDPDNRRCKLVSLTAAGRELVDLTHSTPNPAPAPLTEFTPDELRTLSELLRRLER